MTLLIYDHPSTKLANEKLAFIYQRLSSHEQLKRSIYSIKAQDALEDLAIEHGYRQTLSKEEIKTIKDSAHYVSWYQNGDIIVEQRDMGISGTKGREDRPGLEHLIQKITQAVEKKYCEFEILCLIRETQIGKNIRIFLQLVCFVDTTNDFSLM